VQQVPKSHANQNAALGGWEKNTALR